MKRYNLCDKNVCKMMMANVDDNYARTIKLRTDQRKQN